MAFHGTEALGLLDLHPATNDWSMKMRRAGILTVVIGDKCPNRILHAI